MKTFRTLEDARLEVSRKERYIKGLHAKLDIVEAERDHMREFVEKVKSGEVDLSTGEIRARA